MINRDATLEEQANQWLDECYKPSSTMSSKEKLTEAYRLVSLFKGVLVSERLHKAIEPVKP